MYSRILLAIDLNDQTSWEKALPTAIELCRMSKGKLQLLTVVPDFGMSIVGQYFPKGYEKGVSEKVMVALKDFAKENVPDDIQVQSTVGEGSVYEVILDVAEKRKSDLIVVSAFRPDLKDFLLGPNAARVVRHANCSVLVIRD